MDCALPTGAYPAYTTAQLEEFLSGTGERCLGEQTASKMRAEIERRHAVAAGDVSRMSPSERLRFTPAAR